MCHAMNTNNEWNKLRLKLNIITYVATLKYTDSINTKRHYFFGNEIKVKNTSIDNNFLCNHYSQVDCINHQLHVLEIVT